MPSDSATFLTGSTGFIGQYVLRGLLAAGERVIVLMREPVAASAPRLEQITGRIGFSVQPALQSGQLEIVRGSLPGELPTLDRPVDQIIHCAASLQPDKDESGEPFITNLEGVKALARWATDHDIRCLHYVSTAYVCGRDAESATEELHRPQPSFGTDYELSKYLAELFIDQWATAQDRTLTLLRPSLVIGDSQTGFTTQYGGFYQLARVIDLLRHSFEDHHRDGRPWLPHRIPAQPDKPQNLVPVDYVADVIVQIVLRPELHGGIYHLTNPLPPTNEQVKRWLEDYFEVWGGHFVDQIETGTSESLAEDFFLQMSDVIIRQMNYVPVFECLRTQAAVGSIVPPPLLDQAAVFRMLDFATRHHWGRRAEAVAS